MDKLDLQLQLEKISAAVKTANRIYKQCHANGTGGTALPGIKATEIYPDILRITSSGVRSILISGTNGKTTVMRMLSSLLESYGVNCFSNAEGANIDSGIITTYVMNADEQGRPIRDTAVIECDELYIPQMMEILKPEVLVILPISEDQPDRLGTPCNVAEIIYQAARKTDTTLCINRDCAYINALIDANSICNEIVYYSVVDGECEVDGTRYEIDLGNRPRYDLCNAAAAIAGLTAYGLDPSQAPEALKTTAMPFGRLERFQVNNKEIIITLVKNRVSMVHSLEYLRTLSRDYRVVLGVNTRVYDGRDAGWAVKFDYMQYKDVMKDVVVTGDESEQLVNALLKVGINADTVATAEELADYSADCEDSVFMMMNYTCLMDVRSAFAARGFINQFWEN